MDENATPHYRAISLHLARTLDEIGLNTLAVKKRRQSRLHREKMKNVYHRLTGKNWISYNFGSQTEGSTTPGLNSDLDTLNSMNDANVIEDWADWKQGKSNLLMLHEDTAPGYCRLQLLSPDVPMALEDLPNEHCIHDNRGRVLFKNTSCHPFRDVGQCDRNGPAASVQSGRYHFDFDTVYALPCSSWPKQAEEFITRPRRYGWPSQRLLEEATRQRVFLVPVGFKLSKNEHIEWRISASLAERCLMFSLNIVHIKCYVVLKVLIKSFIEPRVTKCISSYHCKTALLYCTENTEPGFWREDNLLPCVIKCLEMLREWVADLFCPQFMIREENLFTGKVTAKNRDLLLVILNEMIVSDGRVLLRVDIDGIGYKLQRKINTEPLNEPFEDPLGVVILVGQFERDTHLNINEQCLEYCVDRNNIADPIAAIRAVCKDICKLQEMIESSDKLMRRPIQIFTNFLLCLMGSLLASLSLAHQKRIPSKAIRLIYTSAKYDISSMLKLASIFYCSGKFRNAETVLQRVEDSFRKNAPISICMCYDHIMDRVQQKFCRKMYAMRGKKSRARFFAHCVRFSRHEIHCAPPALHQELHRAVGDDMKNRDSIQDDWMDMAVVDCLSYLYFLQYLTYRQLEKQDLQEGSLRNLESCIVADNELSHRETAWNLLGQCWEMEQRNDVAITCYRASLVIRPENNAANKHLQNAGILTPEQIWRRMKLMLLLMLLLILLLLGTIIVEAVLPTETELRVVMWSLLTIVFASYWVLGFALFRQYKRYLEWSSQSVMASGDTLRRFLANTIYTNQVALTDQGTCIR